MFIEREAAGVGGVTPDSSDRDGDRDDRMRGKLKTQKNP